jgi:hypothetical protein
MISMQGAGLLGEVFWVYFGGIVQEGSVANLISSAYVRVSEVNI